MIDFTAMETYFIRTFGCQMNKHDSERVAGLLEAAGLRSAESVDAADVVVFMTCCVRESADDRFVGQVASLKSSKAGHPNTLIAVGGCIGQRDGEALLRNLPHVDVVFGTHNIGRLPALLQEAADSTRPVVEVLGSSEDFASNLPTRRERPYQAWVPITVGCDNYCTYCIVPYVRGRERSRSTAEIVDEVHNLVADGVLEVTLLGQNVNSYGRDLYGSPRFAELLRLVARSGVQRVRFATSHPKDLSEDTIAVMAEEPTISCSLHLPLQSGSNQVLAAMNRHYTAEHYLATVDKLYAAIPGLALSTDVIVGFPGETEQDFDATLDVVTQARFDQVFTFLYSPRKGTPAAEMSNLVPKEIAQERFDRLVELVHASALRKNLDLVGSVQRVLVEGTSKRDPRVLTGRSDGNKIVHLLPPENTRPDEWFGRMIDVIIDEAQTWFLVGHLRG